MLERYIDSDFLPKCILLVEANDDRRRSLMSLIINILGETATPEILEAKSVTVAREIIAERQPELVFTEVQLPDGRGIDLIEEWTGRDGGPAFIVITADDSLENAAVAVERGAADYIVGERPGESAVARAILFSCYRQRQIEALRNLAMFDRLTGLMNRAMLSDALAKEHERHKRTGHPYSVAYIDLDRFKPINDRLGHAAGDAALKAIGDRIRTGVRKLDTAVRLGGDEFVIVLGGATPSDAIVAAKSLLERIRQPIPHGNEAFLLDASIGVATCPGDGTDADVLLGIADERMYAAKTAGGGIFFTKSE
jgi:diguanylate cyclase (GGDEF)-like protein